MWLLQQQVVWFDVSVDVAVATNMRERMGGGKRFKGREDWFKWNTGIKLRPSLQQVVGLDVSVNVAVERNRCAQGRGGSVGVGHRGPSQQQVVWFDVSVDVTVATKSEAHGQGKRFKGRGG